MSNFVGRKRELKSLSQLFNQNRSSIVVIKGRRRIGKSRLVIEFSKLKETQFLSFAGLAPAQEVSSQQQLDHFSNQMCLQLGLPKATFNDWNDAFNMLTYYLNEAPTLILLDEISWLGDKDPTFVGKLKSWWDQHISLRNNVMIVLCGSVSTWIEENIINSTALFGRIALILNLEPLSLSESYEYLRKRGYKGSIYDIYKILAITGGVPWYLEQIAPQQMASENIKNLCFTAGGILVDEFDRIMNDLFTKKGGVYKKILEALKDGAKNQHDIRNAINYGNSGTISMYMEHLITSGFVKRYAQWSLKTGKSGKQSLYSISDPYIRFYLKYIQPRQQQIAEHKLEIIDITTLPGFDTMLGLQIECLLLQNRDLILRIMDISPLECINDNPYLQQPTIRKRGCQIDYLIQTKNKNLFACEFKFKLKEISTSIISEMQDKLNRFSTPRDHSIVPVLFHIGGVSDAVIDHDYFYRIVDLASLVAPEMALFNSTKNVDALAYND